MKTFLPLRTGRFSSKGNISQGKGNNNRHKSNDGQKINFSEIHFTLLLNQYAIANKTIPLIISSVNISNLDEESIPGNIGDTIATPNQNTEKLIRKSAVTERKANSNLFISNKFNIA